MNNASFIESIVHAIQAGLGKSLLPRFAADRDPRLRCLSGTEALLTRELWLLTHSGLRHQGRIAAIVAWLTALLKSGPATK
jgi:DNA-binding transcriptional LysR family regulator